MGTLSTAPMESEVIPVMLQHSAILQQTVFLCHPHQAIVQQTVFLCHQHVINKTVLKNIDVLKKLVLDLPNDSAEYLTEVNSHLMSTIISLLHVYKPLLIAKKCPSHNSNNATQQRFYSKKQIIAPRFAKPTTENESTVRDHLESLEPSVCGICYKTDDQSLSNLKQVDWIECSVCALWVHQTCAAATAVVARAL